MSVIPKKKIYGGQIAAPIFKELSDKVFANGNINAKSNDYVDKKEKFPKIQNGSTSKASTVLDYLNIDHYKTDGEYMISELTDNTVKLN